MQYYYILTLFILSLTFTSCRHYTPISSDSNSFESVYLHAITNKDYAPNIHAIFENQIRQTILSSSKLIIVDSPEDADVELYITLEDYKRGLSTRSSLDAGRFNSLNLNLIIYVSLYDNNAQSYLLKDIAISSNEYLFINPTDEASLVHSELEYQILPKITRELSKDILDLILSDWSLTKS